MPEDISLMSFRGTWREAASARRLTSVTVDETVTARRAVELLEVMRRGLRPLDDDEQIILPLGLNEGETLGPAPQLAHAPSART